MKKKSLENKKIYRKNTDFPIYFIRLNTQLATKSHRVSQATLIIETSIETHITDKSMYLRLTAGKQHYN